MWINYSDGAKFGKGIKNVKFPTSTFSVVPDRRCLFVSSLVYILLGRNANCKSEEVRGKGGKKGKLHCHKEKQSHL